MTQPVVQPVLPSPRFPRQTLVEVVKLCSGVQVVWSSLRRGLQGLRPGTENAWIVAGVQSYQNIGQDERRFQYDAATGQNDVFVVGQRSFTMVLRAQSISAEILAFDLLERVRFRLRGTPAKALMVPTISLVDFGPITDLPDSSYRLGGNVERSMSEATMDVLMMCAVGSDPLEADEGDVIETVAAPTADPDGSGGVSGTA